MSIERIIAPAPTPTPATVGQSTPVTGIGLGVASPTDVAIGVAVGDAVGVAVPQIQFVDDEQSGLLHEPAEHIYPDAHALSVVQDALHAPGTGVGVGDGDGLGDGDGEGLGEAAAAANELQTLISVVHAAPGAGQQY